MRRAASFVPGEIVRKGTELLKINVADYANALALRQSELEQT